MKFNFDLISDLHVETWPRFDWTGIATSPVAVVAGDIATDRNNLVEVLTHLGKNYQAVFYIDGNEEHVNYLNILNYSYVNLVDKIKNIPNVVYLQDNVVVIDGVAILGTNGWWSFDFDPDIDADMAAQWYQQKLNVGSEVIESISRMSAADALYMSNSVRRLQTHVDVKKIIMVTHTVPHPGLIKHDIDLAGSPAFNCMGNRFMQKVLNADTENKIHTWCFGHYHNSVDQIRNGIRYLNHCRGRANTNYNQFVYYPKRITIEY